MKVYRVSCKNFLWAVLPEEKVNATYYSEDSPICITNITPVYENKTFIIKAEDKMHAREEFFRKAELDRRKDKYSLEFDIEEVSLKYWNIQK